MNGEKNSTGMWHVLPLKNPFSLAIVSYAWGAVP